MNLTTAETTPHGSVPREDGSDLRQCAFCNILGVVGQNIFQKDGWYFCKLCLLEIEFEMKQRKAVRFLDY